jgi:hypothetical protein
VERARYMTLKMITPLSEDHHLPATCRIRRRPRLRGGARRTEPLAGPQRCPYRGIPPAVGGKLCRVAGLAPIAGPRTKDVANCLAGLGRSADFS